MNVSSTVRNPLGRYITVVAWMLVIFIFSSQGHDVSSGQSNSIVQAIHTTVHLSVPEMIVRKIAHIILYFVLGILLYRVVSIYTVHRYTILAVSALIAFVYAISDELHQLLIAGRSAQISDVLLDTAASITGVLVLVFVYRKVARSKTPT
jgi:VanZ family protein